MEAELVRLRRVYLEVEKGREHVADGAANIVTNTDVVKAFNAAAGTMPYDSNALNNTPCKPKQIVLREAPVG